MKNERIIYTIISFAIPILIWIFSGKSIPSPIELIFDLLDNSTHHISNFIFTGFNAAYGIFIASLFTVIIIFFIAIRPAFSSFFYPYIVFLKATPAIAFAPIYIIFAGCGHVSRALVAASICFFPLIVGALSGLARVPERLVLLPEIYGASDWKRFWSIDWGYAVTGFSSGLLTAAPLAVVGSIVGDYVIAGNRPEGIGGYLLSIISNPQPIVTMSGIFLCSILGFIFFFFAKIIERIVNNWFKIEKL